MDEYTIRILISDTGPGIPPGVLKKIWDMHFTTKEDGTGIGLQVSRSVIEALGGSIEVKSQVGHGTRFVIEIPGAGKKTRNHAPRTGH